MKNFTLAITIIATLIFTAATCAAKDFLVEHWASENLDIYVMDDTIVGNDSHDYFSASTKQVRDGRLIQVVVYKFSKYGNDMWRYETSTMDGSHTSVVFDNKIFEFCMRKLGWNYRYNDGYYY